MKEMKKSRKQLKQDWEDAADMASYRYSIFSAEDFSEPTFRTSGEVSLGILKKILEDWDTTLEESVVVDYGCGAGRVTEFLSRECKHVIGMDISRGMIKRFLERLGFLKNVYLFEGSGEDLEPLLNNSVDIIYSLWVFQHVPEKIVRDIVKDCYRVLRKGGLLIFQMAIDKKHRAGIHKKLPAVSIAHWTEGETAKLGKEYKFSEVAVNKKAGGNNIYYVFKK